MAKKIEKYSVSYKIFRTIVKPIYLLFYHPTIINKEVIPKEGPIIICSNHIHLFDQNLAIVSTNRMIHYLAKKEHLDGPFGLFYKMVGCIRVDREIHDETAKNEAINILNNGYALGIFPEGTRNQIHGKKEENLKLYEYYKDKLSYKKFIKTLKKNMVCTSEINLLNILLKENKITKEEYIENALNPSNYIFKLYQNKIINEEEYRSSILLPIKFGAVSLAKKTNATIIPCGVDEKYKLLKNKLCIKYGTPFKVDDSMPLEEYRKKLEDDIINLRLEAKEINK